MKLPNPFVIPSLRWWHVLPALLVIIAALAGILSVSGVAASVTIPQQRVPEAPASVKIERRPATPWVKAGEEVTYEIFANPDGIGTAAVELTLAYGSDLELIDVRPGPYLGEQTIPGPKRLDSAKREAVYSWARVGPTPNPTAPGVLAYVTFRTAPGRPWNTWVKQNIKLVDGQFRSSFQASTSFDIHAYDRLPVPVAISPGSKLEDGSGETGPHATFRVKTLTSSTMKYKIEVSRDNFSTVAYTFDQNLSQAGWSKPEYQNRLEAEFISPETLPSGKYQWRAYAWISEIQQWTEASKVLHFDIQNVPIGVTNVSPSVLSHFEGGQRQVSVAGWGFVPGVKVALRTSKGEMLPIEVERVSDGYLLVSVPGTADGGMAWLSISTDSGVTETRPVLVMPSAFYVSGNIYSPSASQVVIPGRPLYTYATSYNWGTDEDSVALVSVTLPDPDVFELIEIRPSELTEVIAQDRETVILAVSATGSSYFEFRLPPDLVTFPGIEEDRPVSPHDFLDFVLKPVVIGEVSQARWQQIKSANNVAGMVQAVEEETDARLRLAAQTFNEIPAEDLAEHLGKLLTSKESARVVHLITRMQDKGLDMSRIFGVFFEMPEDIQEKVIREYRTATGVWP